VVLVQFCASGAFAQKPDSAAPIWANPAVWKSHSVQVVTDAEIHQRKLSVQTDSAECSNGAVHVTAQLYSDAKGHVRKYALAVGTGDSFETISYYYDDNGIVRVTWADLGSVNGTSQVTFFYFDSTGALVAKTNNLINGPGYPAGSDSVVRHPGASFRSLCGAFPGTGRH
jgi:hypothetical protein